MSTFRMAPAARAWFSAVENEKGPMSTQFDAYYLCLLVGLKLSRRERPESDAKGFIEYWIQDYDASREIVLGLILKSELDDRGIDVTDKDAVQSVCRALFTSNDRTRLTQEGMDVTNAIAFGGFKALQEATPQEKRPRSQFELLALLAGLLAKAD
jgi:hypothetical protein